MMATLYFVRSEQRKYKNLFEWDTLNNLIDYITQLSDSMKQATGCDRLELIKDGSIVKVW